MSRVNLIRVATYNLHGAVGLDGRRITSRSLDVLRRIDAHCFALQEFVNYPVPGGGTLLEHWCQSLGMTGCFAPAFSRSGRIFGNAILSRFPLLHSAEQDISAPGCRRRTVLEVLLAIGDKSLHVTTVHLGIRARARAAQRLILLELVRQHRGDTHLLMGDFNEWHVWNHTFRMLREHFDGGPAMPTFPAIAPALALDRIWVRPRTHLLSTHVHRHGPARYASDHLPLVATVAV
jgi:endonuclease/exonuclease/phosphatase family metal-dependent hydrolase